MFSGLTTRLETEIDIVKRVLTLHEDIRSQLFDSQPGRANEHGGSQFVNSLSALTSSVPGKRAWQIYDHCAAFSRLYGVYAQFVEDLIGDYLRLLPVLYPDYVKLPERILSQHRVGVAQILGKLSSVGPYRHLEEAAIVTNLSSNLSGKTPYTLLKEAFFVDRQNYRLEVLQRLFGSVGIENAAKKFLNSEFLQSFISTRSESFSVDKELSDFVDYRNTAAHSQVDQIVAIDDIGNYADLIVAICRAMADVVEDEIIQRQVAVGLYAELGTATESLQRGHIIVARLTACTLRVGDKIAIVRADSVKASRIKSIELNDVPCTAIIVKEELEVGLGLSRKCKLGTTVVKVVPPSYPLGGVTISDNEVYAASIPVADPEAVEELGGLSLQSDGESEFLTDDETNRNDEFNQEEDSYGN